MSKIEKQKQLDIWGSRLSYVLWFCWFAIPKRKVVFN